MPESVPFITTPCCLLSNIPGQMRITANCMIIDQNPIENHSEQGQCAELPLETVGKVETFGRLLCNSQ